jgi:hypothetical protein
VVTEAGFHSVELRIGAGLSDHHGDRLRLLDSSGQDRGWVRLTKDAEHSEIGGPGKATIISGSPQVGQSLEQIRQWPLAMEVYAGSRPSVSTVDNIPTDGYDFRQEGTVDPIVALAAKAWYPLGEISNSWLGIGLLIDVDAWKDRIRRDSIHSFSNVETGFGIAYRKGFTLHRRLGWFMEFGDAFFPKSRYARLQLDNKVGLSLELAPGLSITSTAGLELWAYALRLTSMDGGRIYGLSLVWTPSRH